MAKFIVPSNNGQSRQNQEVSNNRRVRIYEISKELNLDNKDVLAIAEELKLSGATSHSSTISVEEADLIRQAVQKNFRRGSARVNASAAPETINATVKSAERRSLTLRCTPRTTQGFVEPLLAVGNAVPLHMVLVPGGTFLMGSPDDELEREVREGPQHEVTVPPFFMGRYPVTEVQWRMVTALPRVERELASAPSRFKGENCPVEQVTWYDALEFCARLSTHTGRLYRLPSESEWEYACRAGTTTPFYFGNTLTTDVANYNGNFTYSDGPKGEDRNESTPVDHFGIANAFGLCDMHGNVLEWCQDHWHDSYEGASIDGSAWLGGGNSEQRVRRGGSWIYTPKYCRSAYRNFVGSNEVYDAFGFRVCCSAPRDLQLLTS